MKLFLNIALVLSLFFLFISLSFLYYFSIFILSLLFYIICDHVFSSNWSAILAISPLLFTLNSMLFYLCSTALLHCDPAVKTSFSTRCDSMLRACPATLNLFCSTASLHNPLRKQLKCSLYVHMHRVHPFVLITSITLFIMFCMRS